MASLEGYTSGVMAGRDGDHHDDNDDDEKGHWNWSTASLRSELVVPYDVLAWGAVMPKCSVSYCADIWYMAQADV